jgi:hypothetical protein
MSGSRSGSPRTGVDLNDPPPLEPAELLAAYTADEANP